jgi:hypothetical protein
MAEGWALRWATKGRVVDPVPLLDIGKGFPFFLGDWWAGQTAGGQDQAGRGHPVGELGFSAN